MPHESFMEIDELTQRNGTKSICAHLVRVHSLYNVPYQCRNLGTGLALGA